MLQKMSCIGLLMAAPFLTAAAWGASGEVSASGGAMTFDQGGGTHGTLGLTGGLKVGDNLSLFGDLSWAQLASASETNSGVNVNASVNLANLGGGLAYSFRSPSSRVVPYGLVAGGVGHFYGLGSGSGNGATVNLSMSLANAGYVGTGGGARIYLGKRWGIKPEVRFDRYINSAFASSTITCTAGVFWEFGE